MTTYGSPPWNRTMVLGDYGGDLNKRNYGGRGVVDPRTDIDAGQVNRMAADLCAVARTAAFSVVTVDGAATPNVTHAVVGAVETVSSGYVGSSPPDGMPTVTHVATGHFKLVWETTYADASGDSANFVPIAAAVTIAGGGTDIATASAIVSGSEVHVYVWKYSGGSWVATDSVAFTVEVW